MKFIRQILVFLTLGLLFSSFSQTGTVRTINQSTLILKMKYKSNGLTGFGGSLTVRNIKTNEIYESHGKIGFNPFIIIENLPTGNYEVEELRIISGGPTFIIRDTSIFNILELDSPKNYYVGNFLTKKIKPTLQLHIEVLTIEKDTENKIFKQLKKKSDEWLDLEIEFEKSLFKADSTKIEIKN